MVRVLLSVAATYDSQIWTRGASIPYVIFQNLGYGYGYGYGYGFGYRYGYGYGYGYGYHVKFC